MSKCGCVVTWNIDVAQWLLFAAQKKSTKGDAVAKLIDSGATLQEIWKAHPGYTLVHRRQIEEMISLARQWSHNKVRTVWSCPSLLDARDPIQGEIIGWLMDNVRTKRVFKQAALWIHGPPNVGKTSLLNWLDCSLRIYWIPHVSMPPLLLIVFQSSFVHCFVPTGELRQHVGGQCVRFSGVGRLSWPEVDTLDGTICTGWYDACADEGGAKDEET